MRPLRVGVAGAGIGIRYAESFARVEGAEVVALCAATRRNAGPAALALGIEGVYTSYEEMLARAELDIVAIATPNHLHREMALAAIAAGAHVLCDKPLAMNAGEAAAMWRAAEGAGVRHVVPFWWRFLPAVQAAHALLAGGALGEPWFADVRYLNCGWGDPHGPMRWQFERARAGSGALGNVGSHAIHVLEWLAGELRRVCAHTAISVRERRRADGSTARPDVEDTVAFVGELAGGAPVAFLASSVAHHVRSAFEIAVHCSEGSVSVTALSHWPDGPDGRLMVMRRGEQAPGVVAAPPLAGTAGLAQALSPQDVAYTAIAAELVAAIREGRPVAPGFADGVRVLAVLDAALASASAGGWAVPDAPAMVAA